MMYHLVKGDHHHLESCLLCFACLQGGNISSTYLDTLLLSRLSRNNRKGGRIGRERNEDITVLTCDLLLFYALDQAAKTTSLIYPLDWKIFKILDIFWMIPMTSTYF